MKAFQGNSPEDNFQQSFDGHNFLVHTKYQADFLQKPQLPNLSYFGDLTGAILFPFLIIATQFYFNVLSEGR